MRRVRGAGMMPGMLKILGAFMSEATIGATEFKKNSV